MFKINIFHIYILHCNGLMLDWLPGYRTDGETTGAIRDAVQPLYKTNEHLK